MSTPTNHWKLGLFVVVGFVLAACTVVFLGARNLKPQVVSYKTFFDESVQGLEVGSPVRFRGVTIGSVSIIDIASDKRLVEVTSALAVKDLKQLGLSLGTGRELRFGVPPDLRAQLASQGITGVKFLQIDFFRVEDNPRPKLPFDEPPNYIPAARSTLKNLEDTIVKTANRLPEIADAVLRIATKIDVLLGELHSLPTNVATVVGHADQLLGAARTAVRDAQLQQLSQKAQVAIDHASSLIVRLDGDNGLAASVQRATGAFGDVAIGARTVPRELEETLRDIQSAATAIQRVADALERDPDMLLKGRGKPK